MKTKYILLSLFCLAAISCSDDKAFEPAYTVEMVADREVATTIDASTTFQTMDGFASSDAWMMDVVGKNWSASNKEGIAKLLFSQNVKSGKPEGIGLSMWRVNVGGGTAELGDASGIPADKIERRVECFLTQSGTYDWSKSSGQQYFMQKAKEHGCEQFVLFSNTPPVYYTKNGKGFGSNGKENNLKDEHYASFADFLATVAEHFKGQGYNIPLISPVNEPQYAWTGDQEGCSWTNAEVAKLARELDKSLTTKGLNDTKMLLAEAGKWDYLYGNGDSGASYGNVAYNLFDAASPNYIGNLNHAPNIICGHSYWLDKNWNTLYDTRSKVDAKAKQYGLKVYQTEWSMLDEGYEDYPSYDDASYMDLALSMSKVMYHDMATANMSSWSYWTSISQERWSQKSRFFLIRVTPEDGDYGDLKKNGTYSASKNLWVLGNYSLFIRPGYQRVALDIPEGSNQFFGTAYISPAKDRVVAVYSNIGKESIRIKNTLQGIDGKEVIAMNQYTTSGAKDLKQEPDYLVGLIPAKSVVTLVYDLK